MSCGSVDIWRNFTPFMSWSITEIWQTISDKTTPCPTGRQQHPHKEKKRNYSSSPFPHLHGCIMCNPTWAGTFVLAALVAVFPGINFVLLDSDCLSVTLLEVEDLWTEAYLARFPAHCESAILRHTHYEPSHVSAKTGRLYTHNLGFAVVEWVKGLWSSQNHMPNSMQGLL